MEKQAKENEAAAANAGKPKIIHEIEPERVRNEDREVLHGYAVILTYDVLDKDGKLTGTNLQIDNEGISKHEVLGICELWGKRYTKSESELGIAESVRALNNLFGRTSKP